MWFFRIVVICSMWLLPSVSEVVFMKKEGSTYERTDSAWIHRTGQRDETGLRTVRFLLELHIQKRRKLGVPKAHLNILLDAYMKQCQDSVVTLIEDEIIMTTQFEQYLDNLSQPKKQDMRLSRK